jgi:hypothetical protein
MTVKTENIRMLVTVAERDSYGSDHYLHFTGRLVVQHDGELRGADRYAERERGLQDLTVTAQRDTSAKHFYGFEVSYREPYSVRLEDAELMVKVLRKIRRRMDQLREKWGYPTDIAMFAAHAMSALTAAPQPFLRRVPPERDFAGTGYHAMNADGLRWFVADEVAKWEKERGIRSEDGAR